jgi:hypothetical protein
VVKPCRHSRRYGLLVPPCNRQQFLPTSIQSDQLAKQLGDIKWKLTSKGQIAVETEDEMRKRGVPSPDRADALAHRFAQVDLPVVDVESHAAESSLISAHHFTVDHTDYFVEHGAVLLAALRLWTEPRPKTDGDLQALIASANAATLENIAEGLAENRDPDALHASVQLEGIAYASPRQLYDVLEFARKGLQAS